MITQRVQQFNAYIHGVALGSRCPKRSGFSRRSVVEMIEESSKFVKDLQHRPVL